MDPLCASTPGPLPIVSVVSMTVLYTSCKEAVSVPYVVVNSCSALIAWWSVAKSFSRDGISYGGERLLTVPRYGRFKTAYEGLTDVNRSLCPRRAVWSSLCSSLDPVFHARIISIHTRAISIL